MLRLLTEEIGTELPVLKPLTCMPGIYGEADTDSEAPRRFSDQLAETRQKGRGQNKEERREMTG